MVESVNCPLCILAGNPRSARELLLAEGPATVAVLHEDWAARGHAMVVARAHVENLSELSNEDGSKFAAELARVERALLEATGAERAVLVKLGIQVPHLHVHIYPVHAHTSRAAVMAAIDGRTRDELEGIERTRFLESIRRAIAGR
jgi:diadenosine tetraphosphate (Ap4A) HIT family hydrolase